MREFNTVKKRLYLYSPNVDETAQTACRRPAKRPPQQQAMVGRLMLRTRLRECLQHTHCTNWKSFMSTLPLNMTRKVTPVLVECGPCW